MYENSNFMFYELNEDDKKRIAESQDLAYFRSL